MHYSEKLREVMSRYLEGRTLREAAAAVGCDPTLLHRMKAFGHVPRRESILRIADGLNLTGEAREELFAAAGYVEIDGADEPTAEAVAL